MVVSFGDLEDGTEFEIDGFRYIKIPLTLHGNNARWCDGHGYFYFFLDTEQVNVDANSNTYVRNNASSS